jgi:subtilase family serine protease
VIGRRVRRGPTAVAVATAGALVAGLGLTQVATAAPQGTTTLAGSQPSFVAHSHDVGAVVGSQAVDFEILLALPDQAAVQREIQALSTPGSATFRKYLTPAQFQQTFSPSPAAVGAVESWIEGAGLTVKQIAPSRLYVEVAGTVAQAERLVGTSLHTFAYQGNDLTAPVGDYSIPTSLTGTVAGIVNLDDSGMARPASSSTGAPVTAEASSAKPDSTLPGPPSGVHYGVQPCSQYYGQKTATTLPEAYGKHWPYTICGYNADQYEKAFGLYQGIQKGIDGKGVTVAITDAYAAPTILSDADTWSIQNDLATFAPGQFSQLTPPANGYNQEHACGPQGWYGEETLDVESVHAMAPGANVLYVGGSNCSNGLNTAWASIIDKHLASVITDSWTSGFGPGNETSLPPAVVAFYHEYLEEAATTGITVMFSSGDDGDLAGVTGTREVALPASDPYATGVGGTSTEIGDTGQIVFQSGWSNFYSQLDDNMWTPAPPGVYSSGSGGGTSVLYAQPFYQRGVVPYRMSEYFSKTPMRTVPDVAMPGDPNTGLRIGETQQFPDGTYYATYRLGGTSLSSPLFAGVVADAVQYNHAAIGFINPLLYSNVDTSAITDVLATRGPQSTVRTNLTDPQLLTSPKLYVLQTIGVPTTIRTGPGYDDMTGVGTPNGLYFLEAMKYSAK